MTGLMAFRQRVDGVERAILGRFLVTVGAHITVVAIVMRRIADTTTSTAHRTIVLILRIHGGTTTATHGTIVLPLVVGIVLRHATATAHRTRRFGVISVIGVRIGPTRTDRLQLRFLEQRRLGMLLDLQLQGRARRAHATHHAATATTAARSRVGRDRTGGISGIIGIIGGIIG